jgi:hypothetical protein
MSAFLKPGTICILIHTPSGADMGRLVEVIRSYGPLQMGPELFPEAYLTRCVAGRPLHSVRQWLANGSYVDHKDKAYTAVADRSQLRPLPGIDEPVDIGEQTALEMEG